MPTLLTPDQVEANKNLLDMRPTLQFVLKHRDTYARNLRQLVIDARRDMTRWKQNKINSIFITGHDSLTYRQMLHNQQVDDLLSLLPENLLCMSFLEDVSFDAYDEMIVVPGFDEDGYFDHKKVKVVESRYFPITVMAPESPLYHPSRVLLGQSDGRTIWMMPIPPSISEDREAISAYQAHTFFHEFFHTIELNRRKKELRAELCLFCPGLRPFSFEDWWQEYSELVLSGKEPDPISYYSQAYGRNLDRKVLETSPEKYEQALAEDMAECFAAYVLNVCPNQAGYITFQNRDLTGKNEESWPSHKWCLMEKLINSEPLDTK